MDWLSNAIGADWARAVAQLVGINVGFVVVLMIVAYTVLAERRVLGFIQGRLGPNRVGPGGIFQPFADLLKFIFKEEITPSASTRFVYFLAPVIAITAALMPIKIGRAHV
jgi:NADH-quinone oxidoreductase subunit H